MAAKKPSNLFKPGALVEIHSHRLEYYELSLSENIGRVISYFPRNGSLKIQIEGSRKEVMVFTAHVDVKRGLEPAPAPIVRKPVVRFQIVGL